LGITKTDDRAVEKHGETEATEKSSKMV
jgi:hypothetical protein